MEVRPLAYLVMEDEKGIDEKVRKLSINASAHVLQSLIWNLLFFLTHPLFPSKVLAVLTKDPRMQEIKTLRDVPEHILREIACFFEQVGGEKGSFPHP